MLTLGEIESHAGQPANSRLGGVWGVSPNKSNGSLDNIWWK